MQQVNKMSWFFEKIITDKPLARVIKKNHIIIIMNETGYITIDSADIKRIIAQQTTPYIEI